MALKLIERPDVNILRGSASNIDAPEVDDWLAALDPDSSMCRLVDGEMWVLSNASLRVDYSRGGRVNLTAAWIPETEARRIRAARYAALPQKETS